MTGEKTLSILKAGIVPEGVVQEVSRWGGDLPVVTPVDDPREALELIREAVEGPDAVEIRQTDLDALNTWQTNKTKGRLYFTEGLKGKTTFVEVEYACDKPGNYLIPWRDDDISELMLDHSTYLKPMGGGRVHFMDVKSLHFGENKVFMSAVPSPTEELSESE